jgi:transcriptional regulator with XRE-family HTH domain
MQALLYNARMTSRNHETFGQALKKAYRAAGINQAELARRLNIDPGQVSRWVNDRAVPHHDNLRRIEEELGADLSGAFEASVPTCELYVSAPITGLSEQDVAAHHDAVSKVVQVAKKNVNSLHWPGDGIRGVADLMAPDLATERNMRILQYCTALLFLQFAEIEKPSSALIELGIALGRRMRTTMIVESGLRHPFMLDGFAAVASSLNFLPKARIYTVRSVDDACNLIHRNGRELLGLE